MPPLQSSSMALQVISGKPGLRVGSLSSQSPEQRLVPSPSASGSSDVAASQSSSMPLQVSSEKLGLRVGSESSQSVHTPDPSPSPSGSSSAMPSQSSSMALHWISAALGGSLRRCRRSPPRRSGSRRCRRRLRRRVGRRRSHRPCRCTAPARRVDLGVAVVAVPVGHGESVAVQVEGEHAGVRDDPGVHALSGDGRPQQYKCEHGAGYTTAALQGQFQLEPTLPGPVAVLGGVGDLGGRIPGASGDHRARPSAGRDDGSPGGTSPQVRVQTCGGVHIMPGLARTIP